MINLPIFYFLFFKRRVSNQTEPNETTRAASPPSR